MLHGDEHNAPPGNGIHWSFFHVVCVIVGDYLCLKGLITDGDIRRTVLKGGLLRH